MSHAPTLVIDGAGDHVFVGILEDGHSWLADTQQSGSPLEQLFPTVEATLQAAELELKDIGGYIYCAGPGSVLGLRLCAMAIETWIRLHPHSAHLKKYNSLQLCAHALLEDSPDLNDALIVSDWKKGAWNAVHINQGIVGTTKVIDDDTLQAFEGSLYHLPQRKGWQNPPPGAQTLTYAPTRIASLSHRDGLLQPSRSVELYSAGSHTFQKWTPERHRA